MLQKLKLLGDPSCEGVSYLVLPNKKTTAYLNLYPRSLKENDNVGVWCLESEPCSSDFRVQSPPSLIENDGVLILDDHVLQSSASL